MRFARRFDLRKLHNDEGGNVMVLYIAAALLLVGMLWAIIGTGARVVQKEMMQSSADAAAFSAAVIKAKGMNIIAFCNLLMALLLAIIIILRLLKDALILAGILLTVASIAAPALAGLAAEVDNIAQQFANVEGKIEDGILKAMDGVGKFERGISKITPALAEIESFKVGRDPAYTSGNFGSGTIITVSLPVPVVQEQSLPTKDGTWKQLCDQAKSMITRILDWVLSKVVGPSLSGWVSKAFGMILDPFESAVCGGGGSVAAQMVDQVETSCTKCASGSPSKTYWMAKPSAGGAATVISTDAFLGDCSGGGFNYNGVDYSSADFQQCVMQKPFATGASAGVSSKPLPLVLADKWQEKTQVRSFTVLVGTKSQERRQSVGVAKKGGAGSGPIPVDALMTMAQAEYLSFNGKNDLWHMDWRARLVPFTFGGDTTGTNIADKVSGFLNSEEGQSLTKQFLVH